MKNKIFKNCVYISTAIFIGFLILYLYAEIIDPHSNIVTTPMSCPHISFGSLNVTVTKDWHGNLIFFNGNIPNINVMFDDKLVSSTWFNRFGIYFMSTKDIAKKDKDLDTRWWTIMISFWYPIIIFSILPLLFLIQKGRAFKKISPNVPH
jgi:hypothetical protein